MTGSPRTKMLKGSGGWRLALFFGFVLVATGVVIYRLFVLTIIDHQQYLHLGQMQYSNPSARLAGRGNIYMSDLQSADKHLVATNAATYYAYINEQGVTDATVTAAKLHDIVGGDTDTLAAKLSNTKKTYTVIVDDLTKDQALAVSSLKLQGVTVTSKIERFYSQNSLASQVLGFVGYDGNNRVGQYGVEGYYDDVLTGVNNTSSPWGNSTYARVAQYIRSFFNKPDAPDAGSGGGVANDIVLTLDKNIQEAVEEKLNAVLKKWQASAGSVIVEDPSTGAILAMAASPSFDPNHYSDFDFSTYINQGVQQVYEPGSSFKPVTMSGAIEKGVVTPETTYTDTGLVTISGYPIRNYDEQAHGLQTMRGVLEHSLNTGTIFVEDKLGDDNFLNDVVGFGFGQKTGVDLKGEVGGNISNLYTGRKINFATASFGQGIAVTPLQLVNAYSTIANGGKLMRPYVVKEIIYPDGSVLETQPKVLGTPISQKTASTISSMLVDVVEKGFDKAKITGYDVAGKTGTAQIADSKGGYLGDKQFIHNFVGYAPAYNPRFVVLIKMDKPKGITFAADSLSPTFADIGRFLIHYLSIPPTRR